MNKSSLNYRNVSVLDKAFHQNILSKQFARKVLQYYARCGIPIAIPIEIVNQIYLYLKTEAKNDWYFLKPIEANKHVLFKPLETHMLHISSVRYHRPR